MSDVLLVGGHPGGVNFARERSHPVVGQHVFEGLPDNVCRIARLRHGYLYLGAVHSQSLSANTARAQDQEAAIWASVEADRGHDLLTKSVCRTVRLEFVAHLHRWVDGVGRGSGQDRAVCEQHRGCSPIVLVLESALDERAAGLDHCFKCVVVHDAKVQGSQRR